MESSILIQAAEIAASFSLGVCLSFLYDVLRVPRKLFPLAAFLIDALFCISVAGSIFLLGMCCGGNLRFYMPFVSLFGGLIYYITFGRLFRPVLNVIERFLSGLLNALEIKAKKLIKNLKNIFSSAKKWFRITKYNKDDKLGIGMSNFKLRKAQKRGCHDENSRNTDTSEVYYPCRTYICAPEHIRAERGKRAGKRTSGRVEDQGQKS
ncbi:MAG: hypothetical protein E7420_07920 [Ruminococcaceae bacterium]|nr:hypothetical protein [Oscillospiraceae bacterium]